MIWKRWILGLFVLGLCALAGHADDYGVAEKRWLRQCIEALASKSELVAGSAGVAIADLGTGAIPHLCPRVVKLEDEASFERLGRALARMGAKQAADELDASRKLWPKSHVDRFEQLVVALRAGAIRVVRPAPSAGPVAASPPDVVAKVRELLDPFRTATMYSSSDPRVQQIVRLGRPAVGALIDELRRSSGHGMLVTAATDALAQLVTAEDVGTLLDLVLGGCEGAARGLARLDSSAALDSLIEIVERGMVGHETPQALQPHAMDARVQSSLLGYLEKHGRSGPYAVGQVAEFLAEARVDEAADVLEKLVDVRADADVRWRVAAAAAELGVKRGIPALIEVLEGRGSRGFAGSLYPRYEAGKRLNVVVGRSLFIGNYQGSQPEGNWEEASAAFRKWWEENGEALTWDETSRRWRVR